MTPAESALPDAALQDSDPSLADLLEVGLAGLHDAAGFTAAAVVLCYDGRTREFIAGPDFDGRLVSAAREALRSLAGEANVDCLPAREIEPLALPVKNGPTSIPLVFTMDAPIVIGGIVRGLIRLAWAVPPPRQPAGLYSLAQALSAALERQRPDRTVSFVRLAQSLGDGLAVVDEMAIRPINDTGSELIRALGWSDGGPPQQLLDALAESRSRGSPVLRELSLQAPGSRHITLAVDGTGETACLALRDHTEERLLQERLLQSEKMASVGQLVSGVAHELNNPLTGVMGFAQLLLARDLDDTVRGQVQTIYGEAERAAKIVQNLLSFARRRKPAKEMADVNALLQRVLELRSYDFGIRNISLDMTLDPRAPRCWVDPDQVQQVFFNVIKNAEQAMIDANGGGKLTVVSRGSDAGVDVTVADDGPGIPADIQRRIFDPFFTTKEAGQGTGLGLTICYSIVDEHGGRIWAENGAAGGAIFHIQLPVGVAEERPPEPLLPGLGSTNGTATGARRVLVVDDEENIRLLLGDILRLDNHQVVTASTGLEAAERVAAEAFDVIITDMKMPGMDGASLYRAVQERDADLARRIIFITGDTVSPDTRAFLQRVSNPVLSKPFKIGPLREAIETVLKGG